MQGTRYISRTLVLLMLIVALFGSFYLSTGHASAATNKAHSGCATRYAESWVGDVYVSVAHINNACYWPFSKTNIWTVAYNGGSYTIDSDSWQSHSNVGGERFGETGRSGWLSFPRDGQWHSSSLSNVWGGVSDPSWGCGWVRVYNGPTRDYLCAYVPQP